MVAADAEIQEAFAWFSSTGEICPIEDIPYSNRSYLLLKRNGINFLSDLCALSLDELSNIKNLGSKTKAEIINSNFAPGFSSF